MPDENFSPPQPRQQAVSLIDAINHLATVLHRTAVDHGFWDHDRNKGEMIALMHEELSELLKAIRSGEENSPSEHIPDFTAAEEEIADIIIRAMDFAVGFGLRVGEAIEAKHHFNVSRPHKHGKKF
jgi:NTP pyrophosphatase (non-canonical NTP hydrolase)